MKGALSFNVSLCRYYTIRLPKPNGVYRSSENQSAYVGLKP